MELISNENLPRVAYGGPIGVLVEPGKIYSWCSCGLSKNQPFCDNIHRNIESTPYRSIKVMFDKAEEIWFCRCKQTRTPPFCDGSHRQPARQSI